MRCEQLGVDGRDGISLGGVSKTIVRSLLIRRFFFGVSCEAILGELFVFGVTFRGALESERRGWSNSTWKRLSPNFALPLCRLSDSLLYSRCITAAWY